LENGFIFAKVLEFELIQRSGPLRVVVFSSRLGKFHAWLV
jgi:hypothetical protein